MSTLELAAIPDIPVFDPLLDIESLLAPIPGADPTGGDLRQTAASSYHALRDARTAARNRERNALAQGDAEYIDPADWQPVLRETCALLQQRSKDLELTAWLIEALTRCHGFAGIRAGFTLAAALIARYGEALHPRPDEEGKAAQLAALIGLNGFGSEGALIAPIKSIPITAGSPPGPFSTWQCEQAFETERVSNPARREARSKRGYASHAEIDQAVLETPARFFVALQRDLLDAIAAYERYQRVIDHYCADDPQPTARIRETLGSCLQTLRHIAGNRLETEAAPTEASETVAPDERTQSPAPAALMLDREGALRQLREIAAFFRRTEPHSPISYAIEQAVYWSQLSLPELISELIPDENARQKYRTLTGIRVVEK